MTAGSEDAAGTKAPPGRTELILILGSLTAFAPLATDMYLPALPTLERELATTPAGVQLTLASFFLGFALGQAAYGPIADRFGRKPPLYVGMILFILMSAACALAPSVEWLTFFRLLQALGACSGGVIARAMVRDLFPVDQAARVFARLILVLGVAPMAAPFLGGYFLIWLDWTAIFWAMAIVASLCLLAVTLRLPETHRPEAGRPLRLGRVAGDYARLLGDRQFMGYALTGGFSMAGMFAYIAGSPFVFINLYGVAPERFGWLFALNAAGFIGAAQLNARLVRAATLDRMLRRSTAVQAMAGLLVAVAGLGVGGFPGLLLPLFVYVACLGFLLPNSSACAMAPHGAQAGLASALLGTLQFSLAAVASLLVGALQNGTAVPMAGIMAVSGLLGLFAHRRLVRADPVARAGP